MEANERTFNPAQAWKLEDPERRAWLPPDEIVAKLEVLPGMRIADVGAGTGYFALPLASAVGPAGSVAAIDFQTEMLAHLRRKLEVHDAPVNVESVSGTALDTTLADSSCDLALIANVWHELDSHAAVLEEARRILRKGGRLAILDWRADVTRPPGPPLDHRVPMHAVSTALASAGWKAVREQTAGTYSYLVMAIRPE